MDNQQKASALLVIGLVLIGINFLALAPFVAGQVEAGVQDVVADGYDGYDDDGNKDYTTDCLLYTSPSPRDVEESRMPSSA